MLRGGVSLCFFVVLLRIRSTVRKSSMASSAISIKL